MPLIPALQETEAGGAQCELSLGSFSETFSKQNNKGWGHSTVQNPFKPHGDGGSALVN